MMGRRMHRFKDLLPGMIMMEWTKKSKGVYGWGNIEILGKKSTNSIETYFVGMAGKEIPNSELSKISAKIWSERYHNYYQAAYEDYRMILRGVFGVF